MARVGGRNAAFAWVVGIGCVATLGVLALLALPMFPASVAWIDGAVNPRTATPAPLAPDGSVATADADPGVPTECAELYDDALWASLRFAPGAVLTPTMDAPTTSAESLVAALQPHVLFTCGWHSDRGSVSTTLASVPTDAGAIAAAALPGVGFACTTQDTRTRCARTEGAVTETIEAGGGLWLSTVEDAWQPGEYVARTGTRVWG